MDGDDSASRTIVRRIAEVGWGSVTSVTHMPSEYVPSEPVTGQSESEAERAEREDAERELYAELDAAEYNEVMAREAD
jgi:hypothetical protein